MKINNTSDIMKGKPMDHIIENYAYNYLGEDITGKRQEYIDPSFGTYDIHNKPLPFWPDENETIDIYGFDKTHIGFDGTYKQVVILPKGTRLCRYGYPQGRMTTNVGIDYKFLGLPYKKESIQYHEYIVIADGVKVECKVVQGFVAPAFNSIGGVVSIFTSKSN